MAKFDVYRQKNGGALVLDCQADLLGDLNTRLVVPLLPMSEAPAPAARLNPAFEVDGTRFVMVTQFAATVPMRELGEVVQSLGSAQDDIDDQILDVAGMVGGLFLVTRIFSGWLSMSPWGGLHWRDTIDQGRELAIRFLPLEFSTTAAAGGTRSASTGMSQVIMTSGPQALSDGGILKLP